MKKFMIALVCIVLFVAIGFGVYKFVFPLIGSQQNTDDPAVIESLGDYTYEDDTTVETETETMSSSEDYSNIVETQTQQTKKQMSDLNIEYTTKPKPTEETMQTEQTQQSAMATTQPQTTRVQYQTQTQMQTTEITTVPSPTIAIQQTTPPYIPDATPAYENVTTVADLPYTPRMVVIGDKQVRYLSDSVGDNIKDEAVFIYNEGADLQWLSKSGRNRITNTLKDGDVIFLWLGVSDFLDLDDNQQAERYIDFVNDMQKSDWKDHVVVFMEIPYQSNLDNRIVDNDVMNTNPTTIPSVDNLSSYNAYLSELIRDYSNIFYMSTNDIIGIETDGTTVDGSSTFRDSHTGIYFSDNIYQDIYLNMFNLYKSIGGV